MAITSVVTATRSTLISAALFTVTVPGSILTAVRAGDLLLAFYCHNDNANAGTLSISDSGGSALTWTQIAITNASGVKAAAWWAITPDSTARDIVVTHTGNSGTTKQLVITAWRGYSAATPVPSGNVFSGTAASNISQAITPAIDGGQVLLFYTNTPNISATISPGSSIRSSDLVDSLMYVIQGSTPTGTVTGGTPFTIGETDTGGAFAWIALELLAKRLIPLLSAAGATGITTSAATPQVTLTF